MMWYEPEEDVIEVLVFGRWYKVFDQSFQFDGGYFTFLADEAGSLSVTGPMSSVSALKHAID